MGTIQRRVHVRFCVGLIDRAIGRRNKESANGHPQQTYILVGHSCRDRCSRSKQHFSRHSDD